MDGYRRDIDGLRAVAVGAVVIFHAFPTLLPGGFVGVDVFFVISGFLITGILATSVEQRRFSLLQFYERRVRRILPALLFMVLVVSGLALWLLPPNDLENYARSLAALSVFASNLYFRSQSGYFDGPVTDQLLLHTWSLSVEEQFYIFWPFVVFVLFGTWVRRFRVALIVSLIVVSLALAQYLILNDDAVVAFYQFPTRAWEMGLGALVATVRPSVLQRPAVRRGVATLAAVGLVGSILLLNDRLPFPGLLALPACLATAALLAVHREGSTWVGRLLSMRAMVGIGLISYSLYLWHWPALVLPRVVMSRPLTALEALLAVAVALAAGWVSWRFVERPFRKASAPGRLHWPVAIGVGCLAVLAGGAVAVAASEGLPVRASASVLAAEQAAEQGDHRPGCHLNRGEHTLPDAAACSSRPGSADVIVWGDSHADHLMPVVMTWAEERDLSARQMTKTSCSPVANERIDGPDQRDCAQFNRVVLADLEATPAKPRYVVLSSIWNTFPARGPDARRDASVSVVATMERLRRAVGPETVIVVVGPTPQYAFQVPDCLARTRFNRLSADTCERSTPENAGLAVEATNILRDALKGMAGVVFVPAWSTYCQGATCATVDGPDILFKDEDHLTAAGAMKLLPALDRALPAPG